MEGQVTLSIEDYQDLFYRADKYDNWKLKYENLVSIYMELDAKYHELLIEKIYNELEYDIRNYAENKGTYHYKRLLKVLVDEYNMDSIKQINDVIEELVEKYKKEKENEKENVSD